MRKRSTSEQVMRRINDAPEEVVTAEGAKRDCSTDGGTGDDSKDHKIRYLIHTQLVLRIGV